ncbi:hypothetical protein BB561_005801 [Smittium simulii]|uniref:Dipeptidyl-peptidase V n=1 Tax=Smittium simulii TaxID=133385 RepID=A0A2T9Y885_9FUNG|nr:hypothetical protein BB561_005801 [Smittium simulii]
MKVQSFALSFILPAFVLADALNPDVSALPKFSTVSRFTPDHLVQVDNISNMDLSPNKNWVVYTSKQYNKTSTKNSYTMKLINLKDNSVSSLIPKKVSNPISSPIWIDDNLVGFSSSEGDMSPNLFTISVSDKTVTQVTNFTGGISGVVYSAAANRIAFTASVYQGKNISESEVELENTLNAADSGVVYDSLFIRHWDTWKTKAREQLFTLPASIKNGKLVTSGQPVNLIAKYAGEWGLEPFDYSFSPDGKIIIFAAKIQGKEEAWQTEVGIFTAPVDGSDIPTRHNSNFKGAASSPAFLPDGKSVAWLQMATPGYESDINQVIMYDIATQKQNRLLPKFKYSPDSVTFSNNGRSLYFTIPTEKDNPLFKYNIASTELTRLTSDGTIFKAIEVSDDKVVFALSTFQYPNTIFTTDTTSNSDKTKLTVDNDDLSSLYFSPTDSFWFKGALDEKVQALVLYPYGFDKTKKYPVACIVHGGPQSSWNDGWSSRWNANIYANQGFVTIIINFHGGNAYGQEFTDSITNNWGTYPYEDIMKGMDVFLEKTSYTDSNKTVALGASYGGYMMNWLNGHTDRFRALVTHCGVFSTVSMAYSTEELFFNEHDLGNPFKSGQREMIDQHNPERFVNNWKTPNLIIHNAYDFRVPLTEGISAFTALQRQGIDSKFLYFPDENHWVLKPSNSLKWHHEVLGWIGKYTNVTTWTNSS